MKISDEIRKLHQAYNNQSILYVEDDKSIRTQTITFLKKFFDNVDCAVDGLDGLAKYENKHYDIIISDLKMPKMGGREMLNKIREKDKNIVLIVITASDSNIDASEVVSDYYLNKPVTLQDFIDTFNSIGDKLSPQNNSL